ncbi:MAG: integrase core domain-containing protein, partial [Friedmanniella sp.]
DDSASWPGYTQLAPHVLATAPLGDSSPAGRRLVLNTTCYLQAYGVSHAGRAVCEQLLDRWRSVLGPDRPDTLAAASDLTLAPWIEHYNTRRRHSALGGHPPISRLAPT